MFSNICLAGKLDEVYSKLADANPNMAVYKKEDIPAHFHYQHNVRIMPILIEAKEGWTIMLNRTGPFMCMCSSLSIPASACTQLTCFFVRDSACSINNFRGLSR